MKRRRRKSDKTDKSSYGVIKTAVGGFLGSIINVGVAENNLSCLNIFWLFSLFQPELFWVEKIYEYVKKITYAVDACGQEWYAK